MIERSKVSYVLAGFTAMCAFGGCCMEPQSVEIDDSLRESFFGRRDTFIVGDIIGIGDFAAEGGSRADAVAGFLGFCAFSDEIESDSEDGSDGERTGCASGRAVIIDRTYCSIMGGSGTIDESLRIMCGNSPDEVIEANIAPIKEFFDAGGSRSDAFDLFIGVCAFADEITTIGARVNCASCRAVIIDRRYGR